MNLADNTKKLSTKFALTCILPASLLLIAVCCLSLMFTSKSLVTSLESTLKGQGTSRATDVTEIVGGSVESTAFPKRAQEIRKHLVSGDSDSIISLINQIENKAAAFSSVEFYDFKDMKVYSSEGKNSFTDEPFWYDDRRFSSGKGYYKSKDIVFRTEDNLLRYIYPFSRTEDGEPDACFVASIDNRFVLRIFELSVTIPESKWMIFSEDLKIIYHSKGYDRVAFDNIERLMHENSEDLFVENAHNGKVILYKQDIPEFDNISLLYVIPLGMVIKDSSSSILLVVILTLASICILAIAIVMMTRKIVKEINAVRGSLRGLREKKFIGSIKSETQDEMGELVEDFNSVIELLTYQAEHDENTGFYNARAFGVKAHEVLNSGKTMKHYSVIRIDIDNFSFINDIYDWEVGNSILIKISGIIRDVFTGESILGYLGNDIFVVFFGYNEREEMTSRIMKASSEIRNCEERIHLVPHFGVSDDVYADSDISVACDCAGVALKTIKGNLLQVYAVYDNEFKDKHNTQKFVESNKQEALDNGDFYIKLQPKCNISTGRIVGAEALVRWKIKSTGSVLPPKKFIPIFEKNGFIIPLDRYVWEETCRTMKSWREKGYPEIPVSVNVSRIHINNPSFVDELYELVKSYGIRPELLEIEITESALLENGEAELGEVMKELKSRGFRLLMDDFASGYSSLISLQNLPFDVIKIDKALIDNIENPEKRKFVAGLVSFLLDQGKEIVVEGVEDIRQKEILGETGCQVVQGFCFSKPLDIECFEKLAFTENS